MIPIRLFRCAHVAAAAAMLMVTAAVAATQEPKRLEDLIRVMKKDGPAQQALVKAIVAGDKAGAVTSLATLKAGITAAQGFWAANKRSDAVDITRTVLKKIDALQKLVSVPAFDGSAALSAAQDLNRSCTDCHRIYRTTDDDGHFTLKPGSLPGY
jgi:hypothetical protein